MVSARFTQCSLYFSSEPSATLLVIKGIELFALFGGTLTGLTECD
jgi:hypothetical protein